jgi:SAM-dependent methyltransferase
VGVGSDIGALPPGRARSALGAIASWIRPGPPPRAENTLEMLDRPVPFADLAESLADVARLNALFGGRRVTLREVRRLAAGWPRGRMLTVLDVGAGSGDIARSLVRWARRARRPIRVFALDQGAATLAIARGLAAGYPEIALIQGNALALPVRPAAVDIVISALTLHHFEPDGAVRHLAEMSEAARRAIVVNDLARSRVAWGLVWLATRLFARNAMSRHDGPLSVRRAYVARELRRLCERANLTGVRITRYPMVLRQCAVWSKA